MRVGCYRGNVVTLGGPTPGDMTAATIVDNTWTIPGVVERIQEGLIAAPGGPAIQAHADEIHDGDTDVILSKSESALTSGEPLEQGRAKDECAAASGRNRVRGIAIHSAAAGGIAFVAVRGEVQVVFPTSESARINQRVRIVPADANAGGTGIGRTTTEGRGFVIGVCGRIPEGGFVDTLLTLGW